MAEQRSEYALYDRRQGGARPPVQTAGGPANLADILERVLDKGIVIAGGSGVLRRPDGSRALGLWMNSGADPEDERGDRQHAGDRRERHQGGAAQGRGEHHQQRRQRREDERDLDRPNQGARAALKRGELRGPDPLRPAGHRRIVGRKNAWFAALLSPRDR